MEPYSNLGTSEEESPSHSYSDHDEAGRFSDEEIEDGMDGARFSYLFNFFGLPFCLIPLLRRENAFSLFHAKQAFLVWVLFFASLTIGWGLSWITLHTLWIFIIGGGMSLGLNVLGHQRALDERDIPLPVVGTLAETWFAHFIVQAEEEEA